MCWKIQYLYLNYGMVVMTANIHAGFTIYQAVLKALFID